MGHPRRGRRRRRAPGLPSWRNSWQRPMRRSSPPRSAPAWRRYRSRIPTRSIRIGIHPRCL
eukprot:4693831-Pyramimonas_sp.AAC.1